MSIRKLFNALLLSYSKPRQRPYFHMKWFFFFFDKSEMCQKNASWAQNPMRSEPYFEKMERLGAYFCWETFLLMMIKLLKKVARGKSISRWFFGSFKQKCSKKNQNIYSNICQHMPKWHSIFRPLRPCNFKSRRIQEKRQHFIWKIFVSWIEWVVTTCPKVQNWPRFAHFKFFWRMHVCHKMAKWA